MSPNSIAATCLLIFVCDAAFADIRYTVDQHDSFNSWNSEYGVSGTITTDGTTGSLNSLEFITDWSLTVTSPSLVDGIATQTLSPLNSLISLYLGDSARLIVTTESINLALITPNYSPGRIAWTTSPSDIEVSYGLSIPGVVQMIGDISETGNIGVGAFIDSDAAIASGGVTVAEPIGAVYFCIVATVCFISRRSIRSSGT